MKLTKEMIINYLVDVIGFDEDTAKEELDREGYTQLLTEKQVEECYQFNA